MKTTTLLLGFLLALGMLLSAEEPASQVKKTPEHPAALPDAKETLAAAVVDPTSVRAVLSNNHIVAFYGHPNSKTMGILGEFKTIEEMTDKLKEYAASFDAANGDKGVIPAFHIIFGTAYPEGDIGILAKKKLLPYIEFAEKNGILVFLDHQIGRFSIQEAMKPMLPYLSYSNVHLAIDPEWSTAIPGQEIGSISAEEVNAAQKMMQDYLEKNKIPGEKMLVVHQFNWKMISDRKLVRSDFSRVVLIHNADGFGTPEEKYKSYAFNKAATNMPVKGFKLFLEKSWRKGGFDVPVFTPEEILALDPQPVLVMYQ